MEESKVKVFLDLEEITTEIETALEKLSTTSDSILNSCNDLRGLDEIKGLYFMAIEPIRIKNDIINDYVNIINECKQKIDGIIIKQLELAKEVRQWAS